MEIFVEYAKSGRSSCKMCFVKLGKGELRVGKSIERTPDWGPYISYFHPSCMQTKRPVDISKVKGMDELSESDRNLVTKALASSKIQKRKKAQDDDDESYEPDDKDSKAKRKKKKKSSGVEVKVEKTARIAGDPKSAALEAKYSKMTVSELKDHLKRNDQLCAGKKAELVVRCVDGERNGALPRCPICGEGKLHTEQKNGDQNVYFCKGYYDVDLGSHVACSFQGDTVERVKWKGPEDAADDEAGGASSTKKGASKSASASIKAQFEGLSGPKEFANKLVEVARGRSLGISDDSQRARQQVGSILMSTTNEDGDFDPDAAIKAIADKFPSKADAKATAKKNVRQAVNPANTKLAAVFDEIALLESKIGGENAKFKIRTNKTAANAIRGLPFKVESGPDLAKGSKKKGITKVKGIGASSGAIIDDFLANGKSEKLEALKEAAKEMD